MTDIRSRVEIVHDTTDQLLIRFQRIEMLLTGLPGADLGIDIQATILGVDPGDMSSYLANASAAVRRAAGNIETRHQDVVREIREALHGRRLLLLGDSITADRHSWAEILKVVLEPAIDVVLSGRSGDTTSDLLARFSTSVRNRRADLVVVLAGTNDARRYSPTTTGSEFGPPAVSATESEKNYDDLDRMIVSVSGNHAVWLTPPPIIERLLSADPSAAEAGVGWHQSDVRARASLLARLFPARTISTEAAFGTSTGHEQLMLPDGLHPSIEGHTLIAQAALTGFSALNLTGDLLQN